MTGHLLHIGYPKTASNFLRLWFAAHPQLAFSDGGIAGFHNVYEVVRNAARPAGDLRYRVTSSESLATPHPAVGRGEGFTMPVEVRMPQAQAAACALLAGLFPNARVLIVTRGFRALIPSLYSQALRTGRTYPFAEFCANLQLGVRENRDGWDYSTLIAMYDRAFGAANVLVLPYELLRDDAAAFTGALEQWLGLDHLPPLAQRPNPALSPAELYWYRALTLAAARMGSSRLGARVTRAALRNELRAPIRLLQRLRPRARIDIPPPPEELIEAYRGRGEALRGRPLFAPYVADYLID
jgi:hypothetical protein